MLIRISAVFTIGKLRRGFRSFSGMNMNSPPADYRIPSKLQLTTPTGSQVGPTRSRRTPTSRPIILPQQPQVNRFTNSVNLSNPRVYVDSRVTHLRETS